MVEVVYTDDFEEWWDGLEEGQQDDVAAVVDALAERGVGLRFPLCSSVRGSRVGLRELRIQSAGRPLRVLYVFDPKRQAVLLIGGDKTGNDRFYQEMIPRAESIWEAYLRETRQESK